MSVQGQFTAQNLANPLEVLTSSTSDYPVLVSFPVEAAQHLNRPGTQTTVTVFTDEDNPINVLAKVLQRISTRINFVL